MMAAWMSGFFLDFACWAMIALCMSGSFIVWVVRMAKKSAKRRKKHTQRPSRSHSRASLGLIEIDQRPFLNKAATTCRRLRTELANKQQKLREFEEEAMAEFDQWMNQNHGAELTRIRELRQEYDEWQFILAQVEALEFDYPEAMEEELEDLLKRRENGTLADYVPLAFRGKEDNEDYDEDRDDEDEAEEDFEDTDDFDRAFQEAFKNFFEGMGGNFDDFDAFGFGGSDGSGSDQVTNDEVIRLKATYRILAKQLHPDLSDLPDDQREKRWHELQEAYQQNDLAGMQRIEAVCDMDRTGISAKLGLARLEDLIAYHKSHLGPLRQALRDAKKHPAFPHPKKKRDQIRREVSMEIRESVVGFEAEINEIREVIDEIANCDEEPVWVQTVTFKPPEKKPKPARKPKPPPEKDPRQMEFFDF